MKLFKPNDFNLELGHALSSWRKSKGLNIELSFYSESISGRRCTSYYLDPNLRLIKTNGKWRPCSLPLHYLCEKQFVDFQCGYRTKNFIPLPSNSKFLKLDGDKCDKTTYAAVANTCASEGLVPVSIKHLLDHQVFERFVRTQHQSQKLTWAIDIHLSATTSSWTNSRYQNIQFQWFADWAPKDDPKFKCGYIKNYRYLDGEYIYWGNHDCNHTNGKVCTVCMYPEYSKCFIDSYEEIYKIKEDKVRAIGYVGHKITYVGTLQKNYEEAKKSCERNDLILLNPYRDIFKVAEMIYGFRVGTGLSAELTFYAKNYDVSRNPCQSYYVQKKRPATIRKARGNRPCTLPQYYFCETKPTNFYCQNDTAGFIPISENSKFLYMEDDACNKTTFSQVAGACAASNLVPMLFTSLEDHQSFERWVKGHHHQKMGTWTMDAHLLDANWIDSYNRILPFSWFDTASPTNDENLKCAYIKYYNYDEGGATYWANHNCDNAIGPMCTTCMYPEKSTCYINSKEETIKEKEDTVKLLVRFQTRSIYAGTIQKGYHAAVKACKKARLVLLNLDRKYRLAAVVSTWRKNKGLSVDFPFYASSANVTDNNPCQSYYVEKRRQFNFRMTEGKMPCSLRLYYFCEKPLSLEN